MPLQIFLELNVPAASSSSLSGREPTDLFHDSTVLRKHSPGNTRSQVCSSPCSLLQTEIHIFHPKASWCSHTIIRRHFWKASARPCSTVQNSLARCKQRAQLDLNLAKSRSKPSLNFSYCIKIYVSTESQAERCKAKSPSFFSEVPDHGITESFF